MTAEERLNQITELVNERGFVSVKALSEQFDVSEVTIRRDLQRLHAEGRIVRTFGGGVAQHKGADSQAANAPALLEGRLLDRVDVLIATALDARFDRTLVDRAVKRGIPVIGESLGSPGMKTVVAVDSYHAGVALGRWSGNFAREHFHGRANVLDLTYALTNTRARSQGFTVGLREILPEAQVTLSIDAQSRAQTSKQITIDALSVHPEINIIFGINDATAWGAMCACEELGKDPSGLLVVTFGLEGDTLKNSLLASNSFCRAGLAMFPEIIGPVCIQAAIAAFNHKPLARELITPHVILDRESLNHYYAKTAAGWAWRNKASSKELDIPLDIGQSAQHSNMRLPKRIGFVVSFGEHEWYDSLGKRMTEYANGLGIELEIADATQTLKDEILWRQREIAKTAALQVKSGDVVLIDGAEITTCLAEELVTAHQITVITNSMPVFQILSQNPTISLISTGGSLRHASDTLIGPTTEAALDTVRADKLFLAASGISLDFGLSHTNVAEVSVKQAMLRAAREVILLADHSRFGQESVIRIAPVSAIHKVISDNALPASTRLEYSKLGIKVLISDPLG